MSSNDITAQEACEIVESSPEPDVIKRTLDNINSLIRSRSKDRETDALVSPMKNSISLKELEVVISNLEKRGFKVKHWNNEHSYYLDISWC